MEPAAYTLNIRKGSKLGPITFSFKGNHNASDLTDYTAFAEVRAGTIDGNGIVTPTGSVLFDLAPTVSDESGGVVTISRTGAQTAAISAVPGIYYFDVVLKDATLEPVTLVAGPAIITANITQPA